jgi:tetratricopeptide (TPR) repeat protein
MLYQPVRYWWLEKETQVTTKQKNGFLNWLFGSSKQTDWISPFKAGEQYFEKKELQRAVEQYRRALSIACDTGDRLAQGYISRSLGGTYFRVGEQKDDITFFNKAIDCFENALKISHEVGDKILEGTVLGLQGKAYTKRSFMYSASTIVGTKEKPMLRLDDGELQKFFADMTFAIECHEKSVKTFRELGDASSTANALYMMAISLDEMGQSGRALELVREAFQIWTRVGSHMAQYAEQYMKQLQNRS